MWISQILFPTKPSFTFSNVYWQILRGEILQLLFFFWRDWDAGLLFEMWKHSSPLVSYIILGCLTLLIVVQSLYARPEDFHQIFIDPSSDPVFLRKHWLLQPLRNAQISLKILLLREKGLKRGSLCVCCSRSCWSDSSTNYSRVLRSVESTRSLSGSWFDIGYRKRRQIYFQK